MNGPVVLHGTSSAVNRVEGEIFKWENVRVSVRDMTFVNTSFFLNDLHQGSFRDCLFVNCEISLLSPWDCFFENTEHVRNVAGKLPVSVRSRPDRQANNLRFSHARFENNNGPSVNLRGPNFRKVMVDDCKFHSLKGGAADTVHLRCELVSGLSVVNCTNFTSGSQVPFHVGMELVSCTDWFVENTTEFESLDVGCRVGGRRLGRREFAGFSPHNRPCRHLLLVEGK